MKAIPIGLIYSRLLIGVLTITLSWLQITHYPLVAIILLTTGLLTDIFDGIIARKLGISNEKLRRMDSGVDQVFFISVIIATFIQHPEFFSNNIIKLCVLGGFEILIYIVSFLKFRKEIATHSIGAKIWTLMLFATIVQLIWFGNSYVLFNLCFWFGIVTRCEIIAITLTVKTWTNDVPSLYHAVQLRNGKEIKRSKLFNG